MDKHTVSRLILTVLLFSGLSLCNKTKVTPSEHDQPSVSRDIDGVLDGPLQPVYKMVEVSLEDMIQTEYLTDLEEEIGMEFKVPQDFVDSFSDHWEQWTVYLIGYAVLAAIGVFWTVITMGLLVDLIFDV